ncbi:hypothetical protein [Paraburkholderia sp. RL17-337-BIB-A]|uniref:hypothetical protein n=1 Tax=Paraburkholderia sp. RL17-337-BIB-A TaxID=3031636 RepID=UPI0038BA5083
MNAVVAPLVRKPVLDPSQDFYELRREGIGFVQKAGSDQWTDYNVHDPGITILEALCYAITDIGYRIGWRIEDILMPAKPSTDPEQPYPHQAFFTARTILTVNPSTVNDMRRMLIDLAGVRDAWIICKQCACDVSWWAFCDTQGALVLQYGKPAAAPNPAKEAWVLGLYEVLLELDEDPDQGDLNDRKITSATVYHDDAGAHPVVMELRFPDIYLLERDQWARFLQRDDAFDKPGEFSIDLLRLGATKTYNVFDLATPQEQDAYIASVWNDVFYVSLRVTFATDGASVDIANAALRVLGDNAVRDAASTQDWRALLTDAGTDGFVALYRHKAIATHNAVELAKGALQQYRNLDEDYCLITSVGIEEVAVCADIEVAADADIDRVQGEIWFAIEQYMNPPIPFRTLQELQDKGVPSEVIFNGPALANGFIEDDNLAAAVPRAMLRGSDIIRRLMEIDGVLAVNRLLMTKYDAEGNTVSGAADPTWVNEKPVYDPLKVSAMWLLAISPRHKPRLYLNQSRFLFYKNGLPFRARVDEATDTLNQLRGDADRPKNPQGTNDLPVPSGNFSNADEYFPVQYSFPAAYGIGPDGLPPNATPARRAQARDLKAYLMVFEQLLADSLEQLAHTADLFSLDPAIDHTYFSKELDGTLIQGFDDIADTTVFNTAAVEALTETPAQFLARRNGFLDHLLARFGEQFDEYALLLTDTAARAVALPSLIASKIAFLLRYPQISHDRARAFDYAANPAAPGNNPGVERRIALLLGYPDLAFEWTVCAPGAGQYTVGYRLMDALGKHWLDGSVKVAAASETEAERNAYELIVERMILFGAWQIAVGLHGPNTLSLTDAAGAEMGLSPDSFATQDDAATRRDTLLAWSASARMLVVEHLLLRPKFIGDALYPACCDNGCSTCGGEDPYSFRMTYVMRGWTPQYTDNLDLRRYAERTIRQETPAHLLPKICWVGNDGFVENPCDEVVDTLAALLIASGKTADGTPPTPADACTCALSIHHAFSDAFAAWYAGRELVFIHADALEAQIAQQFGAVAMFTAGACTTVFDETLWDQIRGVMTARFVEIARDGWQFERFEWAWRHWIEASAAIDWTGERLVERVEAILAANVVSTTVTEAQLCDCAQGIVMAYGTQFYTWMQANVRAGNALSELTAFAAPDIALCPGMDFGDNAQQTQQTIEALLKERYAAYAEPSWWLWAVVTLLAGLHNSWPGATLHDCDDGSDQNPVRLDSTALGNYPRRSAS